MSFQNRQSDAGPASGSLRVWRLTEFVLVFVLPPALYAWGVLRVILISAIGVAALLSQLKAAPA